MINIIFSLLGSVFQSRIGQLGIVALVSWLWSAHETTVKYEKIIAAEKASVAAAYEKEIQREQYAAREIAEAATRRAEDDLAAAKEMQQIIDSYANKQPELKDEKNDICAIDSGFARTVQQLGEASRNHPRAARRSSRFR